ncbi:MAG: aminotransferase class III-fold pyridoxal phosphate-dependent enzyme [Methylococcales bacterium]
MMPITPDILLRLRTISDNSDVRLEPFRFYINPISPFIYKAAMLDLDIIRAKGTKITDKDSYSEEIRLIDCIGGAGSNLRGYNPDDIVSQVLETHDPTRNYWQELTDQLCDLAGPQHAFPAVSGACAVDIAFTLSMLANSQKSRILIFKGHYAGKTLISLNGTEDEFTRKPFEPLYWDVVYLDIVSNSAEVALLKELQSRQVALIWFEAMQGEDLDKVSPALLDIIFDNEMDCGYFVGIDEILNGMFRTGPFVSFNCSRYEPGIVTLSNGLSDSTFPISVALVSNEIYRRAKRVNEGLVIRYKNLFLNQLGAHIALNGLTNANALNMEERVRNIGNLNYSDPPMFFWENTIMLPVSDCIPVERSSLLKDIRGEGLHLQLVLDMEKFPLSLFGKTVSELLISGLCLSRGHVLQYFCRLLPPLNITDSETQELAAGIEKALEISGFSFLMFGVKHVLIFLYLSLAARLASGARSLFRKIAGFRR